MTTNQTIDGVPHEFVREGRYIVVKPDYEDDIRTERLRNYIEEMCFHTPDCVVVEADWPEYEPVWRMIEARVIGNPTELDAAKATISKLHGLVAELRSLLDATAVESELDRLRAENERLLAGFYQLATDADIKKISDYMGNHDMPTGAFLRQDAYDLANMTTHMCREVQALRNKLAAQPQDDPVAWEVSGGGVKPGVFTKKPQWAVEDPAYIVRELGYIDRPAPVAVDRPTHANPPPGTEPFGMHHDNDGLDEWRKPVCCGSCPGGCVIQKESK